MVTEYGMSDKLGPMQFGQAQGGQVFLGRDLHNEQNYSDAIAFEIDQEMQRIIKESYERARKIITENRDKLDLIANTLLEIETLDAGQIKSLYETGVLPDRSAGKTARSVKVDDVKVNISTKKENGDNLAISESRPADILTEDDNDPNRNA
jgi:cell division protease FtsH